MNKLFLIRNPDLFQGEKYLNTHKNYFEGWYFKNTNKEENIAFIPGINIDGKTKNAFIQVITDDSSYYIKYNIDEFKFYFDPFCIKIANNYFFKDGMQINIKDYSQNLKIYGKINYLNNRNIDTNILNPNIMGPFSYIPFMECNHAILSMQNDVKGLININNKKISFENGIGYIEKDWGCSFPKSYIWCQGNNFQNTNTSFIISIADIPFKLFNFTGVICVLIIGDKEYKFTTYNNTKIVEYNVDKNFLNITLQKGSYSLNIKSSESIGFKLAAPVKGKMEKEIFESINSCITVTLKNDNKIIYSDISKNCGLEIVKE